MIINEDSPLRRLPSALDHKQALFIEGIRYSIEMADLSHKRIQPTLYRLARLSHKASSALDPLAFLSAFQDAWSMVDSIHRLRGLLNHMPGIRKSTPGYKVFRRRTAEIEDLRNVVQHLDTQINTIIDQGLPVWGVLSWVTVLDPDKHIVTSCSLVAGRTFRSQHPMINPVGKRIRLTADLITLTASTHSICLSEVMRDIEKLTSQMEEQFSKQFDDLPTFPADLLVAIDLAQTTDP
jgi:hypothetical protein